MKFKKMWKYLFPLTVLILIFTFFNIRGCVNDRKFYENSINETIIDSSDWQGRVTEFYLKSGIRIDITVLDSVDLKVGDSISKEAFSYKFDIFRKKNGKYSFYKNYEFGR